jgi:histidinol-phosphate aminotransferase
MQTRRSFLWSAAVSGAALTEPALAQRALGGLEFPADTVWLNANENPEGPPRAAIDAMSRVLAESNRYHYAEFRDFHPALARSENLEADQVLSGAGSTEVLNVAVAVFTSPGRPLIACEPTFEAPGEMARALGHAYVPLPLADNYAADVKRMAEAASKAGGGLLYLCNPNNPTSALVPPADLKWLVENAPRNTVILVDEAYLHFDDESQSALSYVRAGRDVIVARTFSKIYGMAGLRVGFACAKSELIARMRPLRNSVVSIVSARAVLAAVAEAARLIPERRARLQKTRGELCAWLTARKLKYIEPHANFVMIDAGRGARELGAAFAARHIAVGRPFPPLDHLLRVTIGTAREMEQFRQAFAGIVPA